MTEAKRQRLLAGFDDPPPAKKKPAPPRPPARESRPSPAAPPRPAPRAAPVVYVIDSHSLIYQMFHAMPDMSSPTGQPAGAVHGFIREIADILERKQPDYLFCAFDSPGGTFRHELSDQYKIHREEMPDDLRPQIGDIRRFLDALGVESLEVPGYEADDILATIAQRSEELGADCFLVTSDKDCRQLLSDRVKIFRRRRGEEFVFDAKALQDDWGIRPDQVVDFQALCGDSVDNVPGIAGVGPKTARELLQKYDTLEGIFAHLDELKGKRRELFEQGREAALHSRDLVRLVTDVPLDPWDDHSGRVGPADPIRVQELCREFGFRGLADRLLRLTTTIEPEVWETDYRRVKSPDELTQLVAELRRQSRIVIGLTTTAASARWAEIVGVAFAWRPGEAWYVPVTSSAVLETLRPVFEDRSLPKIGHDLKFQTVVLRGAGIELRGGVFDTQVADYLIEPGVRVHDLADLSRRLLNHEKRKLADLIGTGKRARSVAEIPPEELTHFAGEDVDISVRAAEPLEQRLADDGLVDLFQNVELPLIEVLADLEFLGVRVDPDRLRELGGQFAERMRTLELEIYALAGHEFNIASGQQLAKVLFEELQLPVQRKTKTGLSTDVDVLEELAKKHPLPAKIIEYRQFAKLQGTYVEALPALIHPVTNRVHTTFNLDVAATGRLSSTDPNLQNIPIRTEVGRAIRSAFRPGEPGWSLLTADYSQIELRILAHFSGDETLRQAFAADQDIHALVASQINSVPLDVVNREMRRAAKAVNFGVIYGQSPWGLAAALDIEKDAAKAFIQAYFQRYSGVGEFMRRTLADCRRNGYVTTILGRRRAVQGVRDPTHRGDADQRNLPERIAINTVIQGSAADLIKLAMIAVHRRLKREGLQTRMLLQIHDELVFEAPPEELAVVSRLVTEEMSGVERERLTVPLKVDVKVGANWAECEPV